MKEVREHGYIPTLKRNFAEGKVDRREVFAHVDAVGHVGRGGLCLHGPGDGREFRAACAGGDAEDGRSSAHRDGRHRRSRIRIPSAGGADIARDVLEYLTKTGTDNVTRPYLLESWSASDDLRTWTLNVRKGIKWHNGREFDADDVVWNINHVLDPDTGSSVLGLMKGYMMNDDGSAKWDANAVEKIDSHTVRLNAKVAELAVPEHLFHYPFPMIDPRRAASSASAATAPGRSIWSSSASSRRRLSRRAATIGAPVPMSTG